MKALRAALALVALCFIACGSPKGDAAPVGTRAEAVGLPNGGFVPYPKAGWDGTLVDLLAADAFGFCAPWWRDAILDDALDNDAYLDHLIQTITKFPCQLSAEQTNLPTLPSTPYTPPAGAGFSAFALNWVWQRSQYANCNVDPATGSDAKVEGPSLMPDKLLERWRAYDLLAAVYSASDSSPVRSAKREAAQELGLAGMNFCMASRLRESMLSADILLASDIA